MKQIDYLKAIEKKRLAQEKAQKRQKVKEKCP
jgi:hypothetical protein